MYRFFYLQFNLFILLWQVHSFRELSKTFFKHFIKSLIGLNNRIVEYDISLYNIFFYDIKLKGFNAHHIPFRCFLFAVKFFQASLNKHCLVQLKTDFWNSKWFLTWKLQPFSLLILKVLLAKPAIICCSELIMSFILYFDSQMSHVPFPYSISRQI